MHGIYRFTVKRLGLWQAAAVVLVSLAAYILAGWHGALSALAGGFSVWVGSRLGALSMRGHRMDGAGSALLVLLRAEAIKIVTIAVLLLLTFKLYATNLVPAALIAGLAVAALMSGIGIMRVNEKE